MDFIKRLFSNFHNDTQINDEPNSVNECLDDILLTQETTNSACNNMLEIEIEGLGPEYDDTVINLDDFFDDIDANDEPENKNFEDIVENENDYKIIDLDDFEDFLQKNVIENENKETDLLNENLIEIHEVDHDHKLVDFDSNIEAVDHNILSTSNKAKSLYPVLEIDSGVIVKPIKIDASRNLDEAFIGNEVNNNTNNADIFYNEGHIAKELQIVEDIDYHSSDFEFISEEEAKQAGLVRNKKLTKTKTDQNKIPYTKHDSRYVNKKNNKLDINKFLTEREEARNNHKIPEGNDFIALFQGRNEPLVSQMQYLENKSIRTTVTVNMLYRGMGFNMKSKHAVEDKEEDVRDAEETKKIILSMYPCENWKRRRI